MDKVRLGCVVAMAGLGACGESNATPFEPTPQTSGIDVERASDESESGSTATQTTIDWGDLDDGTTTSQVATTFDPDQLTTACAEVMVNLNRQVPTLVLLVDRSSSMNEPFGVGLTRWEAVYDTLMDPTDGVVAQLADDLRLGLTLYSASDGDSFGLPPELTDECPELLSVPAQLDNAAALQAVYQRDDGLIEDTPTGVSLDVVAAQLAAQPVEGPKGILLATDGLPDTCDDPDPIGPMGQDAANAATVASAQAAYALGIETYVLSVGDDISTEHLQQMANAGLGLPLEGQAPYYRALSPEELITAFESIVTELLTCSFELDGVVDLDTRCDGSVVFDGVALQCGTDWELSDESTLELLGSACDSLNDGADHVVEAMWPCESYQPQG